MEIALQQHDLHKKSNGVCIKAKVNSGLALLFKGRVTEHRTENGLLFSSDIWILFPVFDNCLNFIYQEITSLRHSEKKRQKLGEFTLYTFCCSI